MFVEAEIIGEEVTQGDESEEALDRAMGKAISITAIIRVLSGSFF